MFTLAERCLQAGQYCKPGLFMEQICANLHLKLHQQHMELVDLRLPSLALVSIFRAGEGAPLPNALLLDLH
jgi:hypothetical protein